MSKLYTTFLMFYLVFGALFVIGVLYTFEIHNYRHCYCTEATG